MRKQTGGLSYIPKLSLNEKRLSLEKLTSKEVYSTLTSKKYHMHFPAVF